MATSPDMTATQTATAPPTEPIDPLPAGRGPNLLWLAALGLLVWFFPRFAGRRWARAEVWKAIVLGVLHMSVAAYTLTRFPRLNELIGGSLGLDITSRTLVYAEFAVVAVLSVILAAAFVFFALLPFAARMGSNRATVRHVLRATLFGSSLIYLWAAGLSVFHVAWMAYANGHRPGLLPFELAAGYLGAAMVLLAWTMIALIRAVGVEYRRPADLPKPRDLRCEDCGYDLHMTDPAARCPECGHPVAMTLGASRHLTPWELRPSIRNFATILRQMATIVWSPMTFFSHLTISQGHRAAHRWLALMLSLVACEAFWIAGGLHLFFPDVVAGFTEWNFYVAGVAFGVVWTLLAAMMVGIETAGLSTVAWWRGRSLDLAAASKVTSYASTLLLPWVILGGAQILGMGFWLNDGFAKRVGPRVDELVTVGTLAAANIGGLLWFEWTVYRGLRKVQYANK